MRTPPPFLIKHEEVDKNNTTSTRYRYTLNTSNFTNLLPSNPNHNLHRGCSRTTNPNYKHHSKHNSTIKHLRNRSTMFPSLHPSTTFLLRPSDLPLPLSTSN